MKIERQDIIDWIIQRKDNIQGMADEYMLRDNQFGLDDDGLCELEKCIARLEAFTDVYKYIMEYKEGE